MRDTYGHWYVYFTYGMHWCANVTTNKDGIGAVLIRAVEPTEGIPLMKKRRHIQGKSDLPSSLLKLCNGPAKFCQAFDIGKEENGLPVAGDFAIFDAPELPASEIAPSARVGVKEGTDLPWRFSIKNNPFVSH